jgi:hypothetical protein
MDRADGAGGNARCNYQEDQKTCASWPCPMWSKLQVLGTYSRDLTPAQTAEFMRNEEKLWWPIVRQVNSQNDPAAK